MLRRLETVGILLLLIVAGCSRSGDASKATTASINGTEATDGSQGPLLQTQPSDPQHPVVQIATLLGDISVRLDADKSPTTVTNFLRYVRDGHYDQTIVHQVFRDHGFLAGGYGTNLVEKPTQTPIRNEARNGLKNRRGTLAMARLPDATDSATSQFFVNVTDNPSLDYRDETPEGYGYCVFGEVTQGLDVIDRIAASPVHDTPAFDRTPVEQIVVRSIRLLR